MLWVTPVVSQATVIQEIDTERIIEVVNEARDDAGMSMLEWSDILAQTASHFAEQIVDDRVSPRQLSSDDVEEYLIEADFRVSNANFASWTDAAEIETLVQSIVTRWRQLILFDSYSHLGIGRVEVDDGDYYYMVIIATANRCDHAAQEDDAQVQLEQAEDILRAVNDARADEGLNALLLDTDLIYAAARWYSDDMREYGYPTNRPGGRAHIGTDGSDPYERVTREGYAATTTRENILARWNLSAAGAFDQWWNSPPHHDNMLSDDIE